MQKMPKKYYAFFTLPTLIAFLDCIFYPISFWEFIFHLPNSQQ